MTGSASLRLKLSQTDLQRPCSSWSHWFCTCLLMRNPAAPRLFCGRQGVSNDGAVVSSLTWINMTSMQANDAFKHEPSIYEPDS